MPRPSNRDQRRRQIARAMLQVMAERGYERASISQVAKRAGLNQGLLHYHFKAKQEILLAALSELMDRHAARLEVVMASASHDPAEQVRAFLDFHLGLGATADPTALACWLIISGEALKQKKVKQAFQAALMQITESLSRAIEQGIKDGIFHGTKADAAASALMATIQGYFLLAATARKLIPRGSAVSATQRMAAGLLDSEALRQRPARRSGARAIYAGTFDPPTHGHRSAVEAAAKIFDQVVVLLAVNPDKQPLFSVDERLAMLRANLAHLPDVSCASTEGYVVEYARAVGATHLVRGLRDATDAVYETKMAQLNRDLAPEVTTLFVPADPELSEVSSSRLKALARAGKDFSAYCSTEVAYALKQRLSERGELE